MLSRAIGNFRRLFLAKNWIFTTFMNILKLNYFRNFLPVANDIERNLALISICKLLNKTNNLVAMIKSLRHFHDFMRAQRMRLFCTIQKL